MIHDFVAVLQDLIFEAILSKKVSVNMLPIINGCGAMAI
jgi:hypothetical protein